MARKPEIKVEGTVLSEGGHGFYTVELGSGHRVAATLGSNLQTRKGHRKPPRVLPMDVVLVVLNPVDLMRGRITELITKKN